MERAFGLDIPRTLQDVCDPQRLALVVYDLQLGIVEQIADGQAVTSRVAGVLDIARDAGVRVFFTRHLSLPKEVAGVSQLRMAMDWQHVERAADVKEHFLRDSAGFQIVPEAAPRPSEAVFDKIAMSAFVGTPLDMALRDCGLSAFLIVGVALEVGIEPTVRHALDLGYLPVIVTDACGWGNREAAERSLATLAFAGGSLQTDTETLRAALGAGPAHRR